jgi:hypothetical protein
MIDTPAPAEALSREQMVALGRLRAMIARDMPSTADLLPNRAGDALRKQAYMLRGYLDALDAALAGSPS